MCSNFDVFVTTRARVFCMRCILFKLALIRPALIYLGYALYTLWKKRTLKSGRKSLDGFDQIEPTKILLVHNTEEWESAYKYLKDAILLSKVNNFKHFKFILIKL